jgi:preprotein translocase subunit SecY
MSKFFLKWFLALFFVLVLFQMGSFAAISQSEHDALMDLYNSTNGSGWYNNTNWGGALGTENT